MRSVIRIDEARYAAIHAHLLPAHADSEEAAFLFARFNESPETTELVVVEHYLVRPDEFHVHAMGYLDLKEETHNRVIKRAHDLHAALIEMHSHPFTFHGAAGFSYTDRTGLGEVVPHVMWRLPGRPYGAIVVAPGGLDALIWFERHGQPATIDEIQVGEDAIIPTGLTMQGGWSANESI
jgi:hypothetical protein